MAQFDVYANPSPRSRDWAPYVVDLQHDMLRDLATRIMAPLLKSTGTPTQRLGGLNPTVEIDGQRYTLSATELAAVPVSEVGDPVANLAEFRSEILAAVDLLFTAV